MASSSIHEIKTVIRGLLVSSPEDLNVRQLRRDFLSQEGRDIPFYEFGFHDVTAFLRSIPDVCKVIDASNGPYAFVRLVESGKSAHVSSLVMRQRTTIKKGRYRSISLVSKYKPVFHKPHVHSRKTSVFSSLPSNNVEKNFITISNTASNFQKLSISDKFVDVPEFVPSNCCSNGNLKSQEPQELLTETKENYGPVEENCTLVPDSVANEFPDIDAFVSFLLQQILIDSEGVHISEIKEYLQESFSVYEVENVDEIEDLLRNAPDVHIVDDIVYHKRFTPLVDSSEIFKSYLEREDAKIGANNGLGVLSNECIPVLSDTFVPIGTSEKVQKLERNLFFLMKEQNKSFLGSELKEKYQMKFASPLNLQSFGYDTVWQLVVNMPHIFHIIPLEDGDFKLFSSSCTTDHLTTGKEKDRKNDLTGYEKDCVIPVITKRNIQWLMQGYPNGLNSRDFEQTYKDTFLGNIELKQMGYSSMEEFLKALEQLNVLKIISANSDMWLLPSHESVNLAIHDDPLPPQEMIKTEIDVKELKERFPSDCIGPDECVQQVDIPSWMEPNLLIEVFVQEINNPHNFWITFCGEQYTRALDTLMDEMQDFYNSNRYSYKMPAELIREGQDCVAQFTEEWHRARITCIVSATEVEVLFYDYGTRAVVKKDNVLFLHTTHSVLPAQAIRAALANISPIAGKWSQDASKRFLQLISNKPLVGIIEGVDRKNNVFSLYLCDTSGVDDVYIHSVLVSEGYACHSAECVQKEESSYKTEEVHNHETLLESEEEINVEYINSDLHFKTKNDNETSGSSDESIQIDKNLYSEICVDSPTVNSSQKSSLTSLPCTFLNDNNDCPRSISDSISLSIPNSATEVTKSSTGSTTFHCQIPSPPPGFTLSNINFGSELHDANRGFVNNNQYTFNNVQPKRKEDYMKLPNMEKIPNKPIPCEVQETNSTKRTNSGVNATLPPNSTSYFPNSYHYQNWNHAVSSYPCYANFTPSFSQLPVNNLCAPNPYASFPGSPLPNPLDYMWYCEQYRQQSILQGLMTQHQMAGSFYPPLTSPIFTPNNYSTSNNSPLSQNNVNISEVSSCKMAPTTTPNWEKTSEVSSEFISSASQTDVLSLSENCKKTFKTAETKTSSEFVAVASPLDSMCACRVDSDKNYVQASERNSLGSLNDNVLSPKKLHSCSSAVSKHESIDCTISGTCNSQLPISLNESCDKSNSDLEVITVLSDEKNETCKESCSKIKQIKDVHITDSDRNQTLSEDLQSMHLTQKGMIERTSVENCYKVKEISNFEDQCYDTLKNGEPSKHCISESSTQNTMKISAVCDSSPCNNRMTLLTCASNYDKSETNEVGEINNEDTRCTKDVLMKRCGDSITKKEQELKDLTLEINNFEDYSHECEMIEKTEECTEKDTTAVKFPVSSRRVNENTLQANSFDFENIKASHSELLHLMSTVHRKQDINVNKQLTVNNRVNGIKVCEGNLLQCGESLADQKLSDEKVEVFQSSGNNFNTNNLEMSSSTETLCADVEDLSISNEYPMLETKLSSEVSASIISGPTHPEMIQKTSFSSTSECCEESKKISSYNVQRPTIDSSLRNLSRQTNSNWSKENGFFSKPGIYYHFVKEIILCNKTINEINLDGRPYALTDEIVSYFTPFNGRHVILKILEARKIEINFLEISRRRRPEFFECLDKSDIKFLNRGPTGKVMGSVHIVPLGSIPYMLRALNKGDAALSADVKEEVEKFDRNDPYWFGNCK